MGGAANILLVDDLQESLALLTRMLNRFLPEASLLTARSGMEALAVAEHRPLDVILLDARMPQLDGFETCRRLKANPRTTHIPVLMVSGVLTGAKDRVAGMEVGADGYLCKPFEPEELVAQVRSLLRVKVAEDQLRAHGQRLELQLESRTRNLKESEQRFRAIFNSSPDATFVEAEDGTILDANEAACELHGLDREHLVGRKAWDLVPEAERARVEADFPGWFKGTIRQYEGFGTARGGRAVPVEIRGNRLQFAGRPAVLLQARDITMRREAEAALRDSEARYRAMVEDLTDLVCRRRPDGAIVFANPALGQFLGRDPARLADQSSLQFIPEGERSRVLSHLQALRPASSVGRIEHLMRAGDGRLRWVQWIDRGIFGPGGELQEIQSAGRDVTEQKFAQEKQTNTSIWLRAVIEMADQLIACPDVDTLCRRAVELARSRLGLERCGILLERAGSLCGTYGTNVRGETTDERTYRRPIMPEWRERYRRREAPETPWIETRGPIQEWTGREFSTLERQGVVAVTPIQTAERRIGIFCNDNGIRGAPLEPARQEVLAVFCSLLGNIIERKEADAERSRLITAVEQSAECIMILNLDHEIRYVNPAFSRIFGYGRDEVIGQQPSFLSSDAQDDEFHEGVWRQVLRGEPWVGRIRMKARGGALVETEQTVSPVRDAAGQVVQAIAVIQDVTRECRMEAELRQAQKMEVVGRLAGGIAHDFNNLLTGILGFGRLVANELGPQHASAADVQEIIAAGERAARLTGRLLAFSRKSNPQLKPLDLNAAVISIDQILRRTLGEDVELVTTLGRDLGAIEADTGQIEQILMNLAINARDAMPGGGTLTIATSLVKLDAAAVAVRPGLHPGPHVQLCLRDTGSGMTEEVLAHVFEPFFTTKEQGKGSGLGLSTIYAIVRQFSGYIELSTEVGAGTEFRIFFPQSTQPLPAESGTVPLEGAVGGDECILVVEDEATVRHLTVRCLESLGYRVHVALHGGEALRMLEEKEWAVDLVLTDVVMPVLGGPELVARLRAQRPAMPVVYMSGFTDDVSVSRLAADSRAAPLLQKPFTLEALAAAVRNALDAAHPRAGG